MLKIKNSNNMKYLLKKIPKVDKILFHENFKSLVDKYKQEILVKLISTLLEKVRKNLLSENILRDNFISALEKDDTDLFVKYLADDVKYSFKPFIRKVVNGTGIVLNTGLGRAPFSSSAIDNVSKILEGYSSLEVNIATGKRGRREDQIDKLVSLIAGTESATVVNNNAAAVLICLNTLSEGKEVIISRGEQVEIGGSFRMPDVIEKSACNMVEIGATNKVHLKDYENAISDNTGALIKVHTSNYKVEGFVKELSIEDLANLGKKYKIPTYFDLGGGIVEDLRDFGLPYEPLVQESISAGIDLVSFSGDKVLGGPQCGIIAGKKEFVEKVKKNPLMRAMRIDKVRLALLEETIKIFMRKDGSKNDHLTLKLLSLKRDELNIKADKLIKEIKNVVPKNWEIIIEKTLDQAGSGTLPTEKLEGISISINQDDISLTKFSNLMRTITDIPVFGYINNDKYYLSLRTIAEKEFGIIIDNIKKIIELNTK